LGWLAQAVSCQARFIKVGAPCRAERVSKLNRLLEIEARLRSDARLHADAARHAFVSLSFPPAAPQPDDADTATTSDKHAIGKHR